jgi:acyl-lipid (7-3)-desaturase (Delta-4 desaturase)
MAIDSTINPNQSSSSASIPNTQLVRDVIRIEGKYYDTKGLASTHPGGELIVRLSNQTDGTALFNSSHRRRFPHDRYTHLLVKEECVDPVSRMAPNTQNYDLYFEICEKIKPIISPTAGFAPWWYFIKVFVLVAFVIGIDASTFIWARPLWVTAIQSLFMAWIGLNVQHDANHGAVSRNWKINRALGLTQDLCGGTSVAWSYNHNVVHHVHCNDVERDHDLDIPLLRLMKSVPWTMSYQLQQFYFLGLEAVFGLVHVVQTQVWMWRGPDEKMRLVGKDWDLSRAISMIIPLRFIGLLMTQPTIHDALLHTALQYCLGGLYLAFFFLISHNFCGAKKEGIDSTSGCFVTNQTETSSNVGGAILAFMNGGLNYQIEHHLFPRVHHSYYHKIAPTVRKICKERGIQYMHFPTIKDNFMSTFNHLEQLGSKPSE